ncbi:hypothetical protein TTHERM_00348450 (macronuclear) [Tetrahymena thermophila SB210]|uniref:Uncharacterized protein n=1 Tax=Tetrahymena thermophila (strain SB210) TaxID=312017 RepID=I7M3A2_TETTS|nr:hypothetical protein TTHERM_00348450 [Tetrahymena thermophila SB210]EAS02755.2 hypothetical protein TTHERM_00348450 [Tetrahymena thermophila SB210]|eukprot:XP_001023000.2 hypothetical protein TTHERM_00348450 [Tetrahymena thermophila SB210]
MSEVSAEQIKQSQREEDVQHQVNQVSEPVNQVQEQQHQEEEERKESTIPQQIQNEQLQAINQQVQNLTLDQQQTNSQLSPIKEFNPEEFKQQQQQITQNNPKEITIPSEPNTTNNQIYEETQSGSYVFKGHDQQNQNYHQQYQQDQGRYKEQWSEIYEHEMIAHSSMDRKRQNLEMLREWDRKRAYFLNIHRSLIESIIAQIDIKMQASNQFMQFIIHYFQNKAKQELQYARQPIPKPEAALMNNELAKNIYGHLKKGLQLLDDANFEHAKKVSQFAYTIEHDILEELLMVDYNQSIASLSALVNEINLLKRQMSQLNEVTSRKSGKVAQVYNMSTPKTGYKKITTKPKDLYRTQLNFLRNAEIQTETQRKLARAVLQFWESSKEIEKNRGKSIAKALKLFQEQFVLCYGENTQIKESVEFLSNGFSEENIDEQFSVQSIFNQQDMEFLTEQLVKKEENPLAEGEKPKLSYNEIIPFFENFVVEKFDNRMLILKDLKTQRLQGGAQNSQYRDSHLVITADNYLHCFDNTEITSQKLANYFQKPNFTLSLNKCLLRRVSTQNFLVELSIQQSGFLNYLQGSEKFFFNFRNSDEIEEMAQFINSLN